MRRTRNESNANDMRDEWNPHYSNMENNGTFMKNVKQASPTEVFKQRRAREKAVKIPTDKRMPWQGYCIEETISECNEDDQDQDGQIE